MKPERSEIFRTFTDSEKNHAVGVDKLGREVWYIDVITGKSAWRRFDRKGNVVHYQNSDGEEVTRKFNGKNELVYSNDCGNILVDKRVSRHLKEKLQRIKLKYKYGESLKFKIRYLIFRIKNRKLINNLLKKSGD